VAGERRGHPSGRPVRGHRRQRAARRQVLEALYQSDLTGRQPTEVLREWAELGRAVGVRARELAEGVERDMAEIDRLLEENSEEWTVRRMAAVDRTILRLACHELLAGVPPAVAINEAVVAANELSTEDSGRFVNGLLGRIARILAEGRQSGS
jgi:N utilization substance protein B